MSIIGHKKLRDYASVHDALSDLCAGFLEQGRGPHCREVGADQMPPSFRWLLDHNEHMTLRLAAYHGQPLQLKVLQQRLDGELYSRKILLTASGGRQNVEFGVMRMDLACVSAAIRAEVLNQSAPLGEILVRHEVLRRIEPRWFLRFPGYCCQLEHFGQSLEHEAYGRVGTIYCDEEPAIELLEIVTDVREAAAP
ncbi:MAG: hypothetical protein BIFFINMI_00879 [Phycisphaerae bacterium]|nr:hypothetical protein [Phycisphaerae bacterium]